MQHSLEDEVHLNDYRRQAKVAGTINAHWRRYKQRAGLAAKIGLLGAAMSLAVYHKSMQFPRPSYEEPHRDSIFLLFAGYSLILGAAVAATHKFRYTDVRNSIALAEQAKNGPFLQNNKYGSVRIEQDDRE